MEEPIPQPHQWPCHADIKQPIQSINSFQLANRLLSSNPNSHLLLSTTLLRPPDRDLHDADTAGRCIPRHIPNADRGPRRPTAGVDGRLVPDGPERLQLRNLREFLDLTDGRHLGRHQRHGRRFWSVQEY